MDRFACLFVQDLPLAAVQRAEPVATAAKRGRSRRGEPPVYVSLVADATLDSEGGRMRNAAGPWRIFGEWWGESRFARDYWDVELSDGGIYRLYHNLPDDSWFVDGVYD